MEDQNFQSETLAETENYALWISQDEEELTFHLEIGMVTINFLQEDWDEFLELIAKVPRDDGKGRPSRKK